jgi:hypothetical protein
MWEKTVVAYFSISALAYMNWAKRLFSHSSPRPDRESTHAAPDYKSEVLLFVLTRLVWTAVNPRYSAIVCTPQPMAVNPSALQ